jgi:hypothetical protein
MATTVIQQGSAAKAVPAPSLADPGPLGLAAFALTTFMLSAVNSGLVDAKVEPAVFGVALFYGGVAQVFAGLWEVAKGNTFGALAFTSYGAFWLSFWYLVTHLDSFGTGAPVGKAVGLFLLAWTIFTLYMTVAARYTSQALFGVFVVLSLTFIALTLGKYTTGSTATNLTKVGGWLGLVTAFAAWYCSAAGVLASVAKRVVLPTWPRA